MGKEWGMNGEGSQGREEEREDEATHDEVRMGRRDGGLRRCGASLIKSVSARIAGGWPPRGIGPRSRNAGVHPALSSRSKHSQKGNAAVRYIRHPALAGHALR